MILEQTYNFKVINQNDIHKVVFDSTIKNLSPLFEDFYAINSKSKELVLIKLPVSNILKVINLIKLIEYHQRESMQNKESKAFLTYMGLLNRDGELYLSFKKPFMNVINIAQNSDVSKEIRSKLIVDLINTVEILGKSFSYNVYFEKNLFFITKKYTLKFLYLGISTVNSSGIMNIIEKYFSEERKFGVILSSSYINKEKEINYKLLMIIVADIISQLSRIEEITKNSKLIRDSQINNPSLFCSIFSIDKVKNLFSEILKKTLINKTSPVNGNLINKKNELKQKGKESKNNFKVYDPRDLYFDIESQNKKKNNHSFNGENSERFDFMIKNFFQEQYENQPPIFMNEINKDDAVSNEKIKNMVIDIDSNNYRLNNLYLNNNKLIEMKKVWAYDSFNENLSKLFLI